MKRDYLWDGSGEPDLEVVRLERALGSARFDEKADLPAEARANADAGPAEGAADGDDDAVDRQRGWQPGRRRGRSRARPGGRRWIRPAIAIAALAAAAALVVVWQARSAGPVDRIAGSPDRRGVEAEGAASRRGPRAGDRQPGDRQPEDRSPGAGDPGGAGSIDRPGRAGTPVAVTALTGSPVAGQGAISPGHLLRPGEWLVTDRSSRALLEMEGIGEVRVGPDSRVRLVDSGPSEQRLELGLGVLHARVTAPPRLFLVDLPSATAVDLGCEYELAVDRSGAGVLRVATGEVSLEGHGRASLVPAGSACETRPGQGPGTPYRARAPRALVGALRRYDFEAGGRRALDTALAAASRRDSLTLWHLIGRSSGADRARVVARLAALAPPPPGVRIDPATPLDDAALEAWRGELQASW